MGGGETKLQEEEIYCYLIVVDLQPNKYIMSTTKTDIKSTTTTKPTIDVVKLCTTERNKLKGRNVSGRSWKVRPQKRASTLIKTKKNNLTSTWEERQQQRLARKEAAELQSVLREERRQAKITKKERRLENEKRRQENEFKLAQKQAQTLNFAKMSSTMKAMSKKQLRQIKKTRLNTKTGAVEYVSAYAK